MKLGTTIGNLLKKAGVDTSDAKYADVLAIGTELPDEATNALEQKLIPVSAVMSNPEVQREIAKVRSEVYDGIDAELDPMMGDFEFDDATKAEVKALKKTTDKIKLTAKKIREIAEKKTTPGSANQKAQQDQIDKLQGDLKTQKADYDLQVTNLKNAQSSELLNRDVEVSLMGYNYADKEKFGIDDLVFLANKKVSDALNAKKYKVQRDPVSPRNLIVVDEQGNKAYDENHNEVVYKPFIDGILSNAKLLAVSNPGNGKHETVPGGDPKEFRLNDRETSAEIDRLLQQ